MSDPLLAAESLVISYQLAGQTEWQRVAFDQTGKSDSRQPAVGSATFWPRPNGPEILVRAEVQDRAGNQAVSQARIGPANEVDQQQAPVNAPNSSARATAATELAARAQPFASGTTAAPPALPISEANNAPPAPRWSDVANPAIPSQGNAAATANETLAPDSANANRMRLAPSEPGGPALFAPQDAILDRATTDSVAQGVEPAISSLDSDNLQPRNSPLEPRVESQISPESRKPQNPEAHARGSGMTTNGVTASREANFYQVGNGERPRMVNARTFEWEYEVDSVGAAGIARIELWVTRDRGQTWQSAGVDSDNRSPIRTSVEAEGVYGYRITVQSAGGARPQAPQAGDLPEMWIGVDLTPPSARLINAELGVGNTAGELTITWSASDLLLAERPITLQMSAQRGGPWTTIAAGLENHGRYVWRYDQQTPERVFLRLEVRDEAGNLGVSESLEPISLERTVPAGKLRAVRPVTESITPPLRPLAGTADGAAAFPARTLENPSLATQIQSVQSRSPIWQYPTTSQPALNQPQWIVNPYLAQPQTNADVNRR
jgi:hypothetical protein